MTEDEALEWLRARGWWEGSAGERLRQFTAMVIEEADRQNLISAGSRASIWARHVVDSAQLVSLAGEAAGEGMWVDLGTGAGFPGMVVACLREAPMCLVEVRPLRVGFLQRCVEALGLRHVEIVGSKVEKATLSSPAAVISARAFAPLDRLLTSARHLSDENTVWLLPKGRQGEKELAIARRDWQAVFHVEQSITDPESVIVTVNQLKTKPVARSQSGRRPLSRRRP